MKMARTRAPTTREVARWACGAALLACVIHVATWRADWVFGSDRSGTGGEAATLIAANQSWTRALPSPRAIERAVRPRGERQGESPRVAICLVGAFRTFAQSPGRVRSLARQARAWKGDVFIAAVGGPCHSPGSVKECEAGLRGAQELSPKAIIAGAPLFSGCPSLPPTRSNEVDDRAPPWTLAGEWHAVANCFEQAIRYARRAHSRPYDLFIRGDPAVEHDGPLPLPTLAGDAKDVHLHAVRGLEDSWFVVDGRGLVETLALGLESHGACAGHRLLPGAERALPWLPAPEREPSHANGGGGLPSEKESGEHLPEVEAVAPRATARRRRLAMADPEEAKKLSRSYPRSQTTAMCIVGELRTFAVPAVHRSLREAATILQADVFVHHHTRFDPDDNGPKAHHSLACEADASAMAQVRPRAIFQIEPVAQICKLSAAIQYHQVSHCFVEAARFGAKYRQLQYRAYFRARPDLLIQVPVRPPEFNTGDTSIHHVMPQKDFLFALYRSGLWRFLRVGNKQYRGCPIGPWGFEFMSYFSTRPQRWQEATCILRSPSQPDLGQTAASCSHTPPSMKPYMESLRNASLREPSLLSCTLVAGLGRAAPRRPPAAGRRNDSAGARPRPND